MVVARIDMKTLMVECSKAMCYYCQYEVSRVLNGWAEAENPMSAEDNVESRLPAVFDKKSFQEFFERFCQDKVSGFAAWSTSLSP